MPIADFGNRSGNHHHVRRLSNTEVSHADLIGGPNVIVPPKHLMAKSDAYETAKNFELAMYHLEEDVSSPEVTSRAASPTSTEALETTDRYAFAFDIDGVLIRGGKAIPAAIEALRVLNGDNEYGIKV